MLTMAVDPGGTTGWCISEGREVLRLGQIPGAVDGMSIRAIYGKELLVVRELMGLIIDWEPEVLIIEDFVLYADGQGGYGDSGARSGISPVRITAMMLVWLLEVLPEEFEFVTHMKIVFQGAGEMGVMTDERLKALGLWVAGQPHAMDAVRHAMVYQRKNMKVVRPGEAGKS